MTTSPIDFSCFVLQSLEIASKTVASGGRVSDHALHYMRAHPNAMREALKGYAAMPPEAVTRALARASRHVREILANS